MEKKALSSGDLSVQDSTVEMFKKAKKSIEELMKVAERTYEQLSAKSRSLQSGGRDTLSGIKSYMGKLTVHLPKVVEVRCLEPIP
jgi:hypothetical protein